MARRATPKESHAQPSREQRTRENLARLQKAVQADRQGPMPPIRIARRPLAYAWRDPQELAGLVEPQYLARWSAPEMPR